MDDMLAGRVAVKALEQEQVDGGDRIKKAVAPGVSRLATGVFDCLLGQRTGDVLPEAVQNGDDARWHGRAPSGACAGLYPDRQDDREPSPAQEAISRSAVEICALSSCHSGLTQLAPLQRFCGYPT